MEISPDMEPTDDGSLTLIHPVYREAYHSTRGAVGESMHVFINNGLSTIDKKRVRVLEIGFGSGLNAWHTLDYARRNGISVEYHAVELYPVSLDTASHLGYTDDPLFMDMHGTPWGEAHEITPYFSLTKLEMDLAETDFCTTFDIIYFDAFAPDCQPEMWSAEVFSEIYDHIAEEGILITYSSKGIVKKALREVGFEVKRLPGALGKRHMIRAVKTTQGNSGALNAFNRYKPESLYEKRF